MRDPGQTQKSFPSRPHSPARPSWKQIPGPKASTLASVVQDTRVTNPICLMRKQRHLVAIYPFSIIYSTNIIFKSVFCLLCLWYLLSHKSPCNFFFFWSCLLSCGILVPQMGINPHPLQWKLRSSEFE